MHFTSGVCVGDDGALALHVPHLGVQVCAMAQGRMAAVDRKIDA
jgi:hypothetical protein